MNLFNINPHRIEYPQLDSVRGFRIVGQIGSELQFECEPQQICRCQIFRFDDYFWSVIRINPANKILLRSLPRYTAIKLLSLVLRGSVSQCDGLKFLASEYPEFLKMQFSNRQRGAEAVYLPATNSDGSMRFEGDDRLYFFDRWETPK